MARSIVVLTLAIAAAGAALAQGGAAVVTGAERVFIRRGPGTEFPPFASIAKGSSVEVEEMQGEWARIKTATGQSGYINSNFLALPGEHAEHPAAASAPPPPGTEHKPVDQAKHDTAADHKLAERNQQLEADVQRLQAELAAAQQAQTAPATAVPVPTGASDLEKVQAELARLSVNIEALERRIDTHAPDAAPLIGDPTTRESSGVSASAALLGVFGALIGWLLGNAYGRRHERGRRPRVRF